MSDLAVATILIVDDEIENCQFLEALLRPEGYLTISAADGEAALAAIAQSAPDLILLDIVMPGMDGYQLAALLKANPATAAIPIIMVTSYLDPSARLAALNAGAEEFLTRPVDRAELWLRVRNLLRLKAFSDLLQNSSAILERQVEARTVELQRFRTAMDVTADAITLVDRATMRFVEVNAAACTMFGYTREELFQLSPAQLGKATLEHLESVFDAIIAGDTAQELAEIQIRRKDGSQSPVEVRRQAYQSGTDWIIVGVLRDITARKRADQLLRLEQTVTRSLADAGSGSAALKAVIRAICEVQDWDCGRYLQVDEAAGVLRFGEFWYVADEAIEKFIAGKRGTVYEPGVGLAGRVWQSGQPIWVANVQDDAHALHAAVTLETGIHGAFHFPVVSSGKTIGVLAFNSRQVREPDDRLLQAVNLIGSQIGQFMVRIAQQERIARLNRVYGVLSGINTLIIHVRERQELFDSACRIAVEQGSFGIAWIGKLDPDTLDVTPVAWAGAHAELFTREKATADATRPEGRGGVGRAIRERKPIFNNDIGIDLERNGKRRTEALRLGYRSRIVLPLIVDGAAVGSMSLFAREPDFFTADELKLLTELAGNISFALDHINKEEKIARWSRIQAVKSNINALIVRVRDRQELFEGACRIAVEHGGFELAYIAKFDTQTLKMLDVAWSGSDADAFITLTSRGGNLATKALNEKRAIFVNDLTKEPTGGGPRRQEAIRRGYRSLIVLPLLLHDMPVANISLYSKEPNFFTEEELPLLDELANNISFALDHIGKEDELKASELRFRQIAENIDVVFFLQNLDSTEIYYVSPAYEEIWGQTCNSLYANPASWSQAIHPDDLAHALTQFKAGQNTRFNYEFRIVRPDGETRWIHVRGFPILDDAGNPYRTAGFASDVTERAHAAQHLRESERRFSDMLDNVELVSVMLDTKARVTYCNDYLLRLTGWRRDEVIGAGWIELFLPPETSGMQDKFAELIDSKPEALHHENEILTRSGERRLIRWNNSVLRSGAGDVIGTASIGEDITDRTMADEVLKTRAAELEKFHRLSVGRELQMIELKKQINEMAKQAGQPPPFPLAFLAPQRVKNHTRFERKS